jgi:RHS repeat-associated protein
MVYGYADESTTHIFIPVTWATSDLGNPKFYIDVHNTDGSVIRRSAPYGVCQVGTTSRGGTFVFTKEGGTMLPYGSDRPIYDFYIISPAGSTDPSKDSEDASTDEPIDTKNGNNYFMESRISVPCPGISLEVDLHYQSLADWPTGTLGEGWCHSLEWSLDVQTNQAVLYTGDGKKRVFGEDGNGGYFSPEGTNWTLEETVRGYEVGMPGGWAYAFDTNGVLSSIYDAWSNAVKCSYGSNDCLESAIHSNGRQLAFSNEWHAASDEWRVASISVQGGVSLAFDYNANGQFTQVVEQVGANCYTSFYHYADSFLTNKVNGAGFEYSFGYEAGTNGLLNGKGTHLDVDGYYEHEVEYPYPELTDVRYSVRGREQVYRYYRSQDKMLATKYGPGANVSDVWTRGVDYSYAVNSEDKIEVTLFDNATGASWSEWMLYDGAHNVTNFSVGYGTTNRSLQLSMEYDTEWNLPAAMVDADGSRIETLYTNGSPLAVKSFYSDTQSHDTYFRYNANGLVTAITNANDHVVTYTYDTSGNLSALIPEIGPIVTNTYDALGFLKTTEFYVAESELRSRRTTEYGRDAKGRVEWIGHPDGLTNSYAYNALGYLTNSVDRTGRETDYTYAPTRKLTSVTQYLEQGGSNIPVCVGYDLDEQVNVLSIIEPRGRYVESYQLDLQDRIISVTNIESQVMSIDYAVGNFVMNMTRFDGSILTNSYDGAGRKTSTTYTAAGANPVMVSYDYYADSQLQSIDDGSSTNGYAYNKKNYLTSATNMIASLFSVAGCQYDPVGNVTSVNVTINDTETVSSLYTYDAAERLSSIAGSVSGSTTNSVFLYHYNLRNGAVSSVQNTVSGITCFYGYDIMERIATITYSKANGSLICLINYDYDDAGTITNKAITGVLGGWSLAYEYDSINRLTGETRSTNGVPYQLVEYDYDLAGNRQVKTAKDNSVSYTSGLGNRLDSWSAVFTNNLEADVSGTSSETIGTDDRWGELWVSNLTAQVGMKPQLDGMNFFANKVAMEPGTNEFVAAIRDEAGNMGYATNTVVHSVVTNAVFLCNSAGCITNIAHSGTGGYSDVLALEWDERYRLTKSDDGVREVGYGYDVLNRKVSCTVGGTTEYYIYDGDQVVADVDSSGTLLRSYVWGMGIDNLMSFTDHRETNTYYAVKDLQNTVIALTDSNGAVVETYECDAYGRTRVFSAAGKELTVSAYGNRYCFQGREIDWSTGLYYFRARWYNPEVGRWLAKDPIGIAGGLNLYEFCGSNPANFIDPFGLIVSIHTRSVNKTGGMGAHSYITVTDGSGQFLTSGSYNIGGRNVAMINHPSDLGTPRTSSIVVPPPSGMTQREWDEAVRKAARNREVNQNQAYELFGGDGGTTSGNCHTTTRGTINDAGGQVPPGYNPRGLNPGLHP